MKNNMYSHNDNDNDNFYNARSDAMTKDEQQVQNN